MFYVFPVYFTKASLNAFYNVLLELVLILTVFGASAAVPGLFLIGWQFPRWDESTKKMYDKSEIASKPTRFEPEKSEKNRRNLRLIQTCDFFYFVHFVYNFL